MPVKLDLSKAWDDAVALISANKDVLLVVAGVFFFLPNVAVTMLMPAPDELAALSAGANAGAAPDPELALAQLATLFSEFGWLFIVMGLLQTIGVLGLLALLTDAARPTVGEALMFGVKALVPYFLAQILIGLGTVLAVGILIALGSAINQGIAVLLGMIAVVAMIYVWVKVSLLAPVIAIDKVVNPIAALSRSWQLTKGNSLRITLFFVLLVIAAMVISLVLGLVFGVFSLIGDHAFLIISAIGNGLVNMAVVVVMLAVLAAIHRQLSGKSNGTISQTFE